MNARRVAILLLLVGTGIMALRQYSVLPESRLAQDYAPNQGVVPLVGNLESAQSPDIAAGQRIVVGGANDEHPHARILVQDWNQNPLARAEALHIGQSTRSLGITGADGTIVLQSGDSLLSAASTEPARLIIECKGYEPADIDVHLTEGLDCLIRLRAEGVISGQVILHAALSGHSLENVKVIATTSPVGYYSADIIRDAVAGRKSGAYVVATADGEGKFLLNGLQIGRQYYLVAGGGGLMSSLRMASIAEGASDVAIQLNPVYCAVARLVDQSGVPLELCGSMVLQLRDGFRLEPGSSARLIPPRLGVLCGIPTEFLETAGSRWVCVATSPDPLPVLSAHLQLSLPGYAESSFDIGLTAAWETIEEVSVTVPSLGGRLGDVVVRLRDKASLDGVKLLLPNIRLHLSNGTVDYAYAIGSGSEALKISGVPHGSYNVSAVASYGSSLAVVPQRIEIGHVPGNIELVVEPYDCATIDAINSDGTPYRGPLELHVSRGRIEGGVFRGSGDTIAFPGPPFKIPLPDPNLYCLSVGLPARCRFESTSSPTAVIEKVPGVPVVLAIRRE